MSWNSSNFAKCDDVIVNFCVRSQTIVKLDEFKKHVEESQNIVLTDEQAKTVFHMWLGNVYATMDGQQAIVDNDIDSDNDMDYLMEVFWDNTVGDNLEIPKDWWVAKCGSGHGCSAIAGGTYGKDDIPLCEEHRIEEGFNSEGDKGPDPCKDCGNKAFWIEKFDRWSIVDNLCENCSQKQEQESEAPYCDKHEQTMFNKDGVLCGGCAEEKEVTIVSDKPEVIDFFKDKTVRDAEMEALKDRVMRLEMAMIRINSKVVFEVAKTTEALLSSGPAFPVTMVSKKDILLAFEKLQSTLAGVLVNPI
jgi:hypothetical protein